MRFTWLIEGELPFTLNMPSGTYIAKHAGIPYSLEILQELIGVAINANAMMVGTVEKVREQLGERWDTTFKHELRTFVRHKDEVDVTSDQLVKPTDEDLFSGMQNAILRGHPDYAGDMQELEAAAHAAADAMSEEERRVFIEDTALRITADRFFPNGEVKTFCMALNVLIRLYMTTFGDFFVEEVLPQHFSNTALHGLNVSCHYNGVNLQNCRDAGGRFPFILRRPWLTHPELEIQGFREQLQDAVEPDPIELLGIRARGFLIRGAYRSAINEASAALDLSVTRKIRTGLGSQGKTTQEIDAVLKKSVRLSERGKKILKDAVGKSAADVDPALWQAVTEHRKQRQGVAHADREPPEEEANQAVEDMLAMAGKIDVI